MRKAERLFQLLTLLRSRRGVITAEQLAEKLEVSERTIYRDIQALSLSGVPIESEAGVGYRLKPGFSVPPLMFDEAELEALLLGVRMVQGWADKELGRAADSALAKIHAVLPDRQHLQQVAQPEWLLVPDFWREQSAQFSDRLREAIKAKQVISLSYVREDGQASDRPVWPLGMIYWGKVWCLLGWCELRQDYRQFRLDRIQALAELPRCFEASACCSLQHYLSQWCDDKDATVDP
ncbi:helix-turn-helix transcriptional regulator [Marinobacterium jannaschii]|uniref:helix-turn-helix transcriptional regulator n=1 Tax=Marinobacterium jannaschii TaxID=64970 RepID=UPI0004871EBF|nr:YafY family protein [Marinobacterium jannaschii]